MREERGHIAGNQVIAEPYTLWGSVHGNVMVREGAKFYMRGAIYGDLIVEAGGRVHVFGNVSGNMVVLPKSKVIHSGTIGGDVTNRGGRLYIDATARILGKLKSLEGDTTIEQSSRIE